MPKKRANGEGSIRKRKDGRWEGRYTAGCDPTHRQAYPQERPRQNPIRSQGKAQAGHRGG